MGLRGAEGPTSLRSLPFAPQRVVAVTRAPRLFYRRPRAPRRRAGASAGGSAPARREGRGRAPAGPRGRSSRRLASGSPGGKGRAAPEGAEAAVLGTGRLQERRGGWGSRARARVRGRRRGGVAAPPAESGDAPAAPPSPHLGSANPAPPRPAVNLLHPAPPSVGALPGLQRRAGQGPSLQPGWGHCAPRPEKRPVSKDEITVCFSPSCSLFLGESWDRGPKRAYAGGGWGQKPRMIDLGAPGLRK